MWGFAGVFEDFCQRICGVFQGAAGKAEAGTPQRGLILEETRFPADDFGVVVSFCNILGINNIENEFLKRIKAKC
jgi:hypothetical protein